MSAAHPTILVLDGETRAALAVVRSLGEAGYKIAAASDQPRPIAAASRYCSIKLHAPSLRRAPGKFREWLLHIAGEVSPAALLPLTDASVAVVSELKAALPGIVVPIPDGAVLDQVSSKGRLISMAAELGLAVPKTLHLLPLDAEKVLESADASAFPVCVKGDSSNSLLGDRFLRPPLCYCSNISELKAVFQRYADSDLRNVKFLIQEKIEGEGIGYFALCRDGRPVAEFAHRRLLEKPPSGGVSVLSESIPLSDAPVEQSRSLLSALGWNGVAMVEYKREQGGRDVLMEVNGRFWGSLQLAISSGVDFPVLLLEEFGLGLSRNGSLSGYKIGQRLRWTLGTLDHLLIRAKERRAAVLKDLVFENSLKLFSAPGETAHETFSLRDPKPFFSEVLNYLWSTSR